MGLFKNGVGRPSNELIRKRKTFYLIIIIAVILAIGAGAIFVKKHFFGEVGSKSKNASISGNEIKGDIATAADYTKGDKKITSEDSDLILQFTVRLKTPSSTQKKYADIDGDGEITSADARIVARIAAGLGDEKKDKNLAKRVAAGYGDVASAPIYTKSDGKLTMDDVDAISEIISKETNISNKNLNKLDFNSDNALDGSDVYILEKKVNKSSSEDLSTKQKAILETAYSLLSRGKNIQYDGYRRNNNSSAEDATDYSSVFTVCSGFTYLVYNNTFDISKFSYKNSRGQTINEFPLYTDNIKILAKNNKSLTAFYYDQKYLYDGTTGYKDPDFYKKVEAQLQVGDILEYKMSDGRGHAMLYVGNGQLMESHTPEPARIEKSWAASYNYNKLYDKPEKYGTITLYNLKRKLQSFANKKGADRIDLFAIRPLNDSRITLSESAKLRMQFPGLKITKTAEILDNDNKVIKTQLGTANIGDKIRYKVTIENTSTSNYKGVLKLEEKYSTGVLTLASYGNGFSYKKGSGTLSGSVSNLKKGEKKTFTYILKVRETAKINSLIKTTGKVYSDKNKTGIETSRFEIIVGNSFANYQKNSIISTISSRLKDTNDALDTTGLAFVKTVYNNSLTSKNIKSVNKQNIIKGLNNIGSLSSIITSRKSDDAEVKKSINGVSAARTVINEKYSKLLIGNYFGIRIAEKSENGSGNNIGTVKAGAAWNGQTTSFKNDRTRELRKEMLEAGDLVYASTKNSDGSETDKMYIYDGKGNLYRKYLSGKKKMVEIYSSTSYKSMTLGGSSSENKNTNTEKFLRDIVGNNFVVLKPSNLY